MLLEPKEWVDDFFLYLSEEKNSSDYTVRNYQVSLEDFSGRWPGKRWDALALEDFRRYLYTLSKEQRLWFTLQNTAITRVDFFPDRTDFVYHNRVNFLPRDLIT